MAYSIQTEDKKMKIQMRRAREREERGRGERERKRGRGERGVAEREGERAVNRIYKNLELQQYCCCCCCCGCFSHNHWLATKIIVSISENGCLQFFFVRNSTVMTFESSFNLHTNYKIILRNVFTSFFRSYQQVRILLLHVKGSSINDVRP